MNGLPQWLFFVWVVKWVCAVFGAIFVSVAIVMFLVALLTDIRDCL